MSEATSESPLVGSKPANALAQAAKEGPLVSYVEPDELTVDTIARVRAGASASESEVDVAAAEFRAEWSNNHYHGPDPAAYARLRNNEQRALAAGSSPAALGLQVTGTLRLLTVLVDFSGPDNVENFIHPVSVADRTCITETLTLQGPVHNQLAAPGPRDNYTFWRSSFERDYYEKLISSTEGITERVRPDLIDPEDGQPGINIAGYTMRNYYGEQSSGRVQFDTGPRGVIGWITLPHSEGYYAANACFLNPETGEYEAGGVASMDGLPQNPAVEKYGTGRVQIVTDVIAAINAADANFPWADYDTDGDGSVDHVVFVHAGEDRARGGPFTAFWAHRSPLPADPDFLADNNGTPEDTSDDVSITGYTMQYERLDLGVLAHEFGHDLGLPDLYSSNDNDSDTSVGWWDLMSSGSNMGKLFGFPPSGMSAWTKFALGWTDPEVVAPSGSAQDVLLGQSSQPPTGSTQAVRVDLPPSDIQLVDPGDEGNVWWTGNDQNGADLTLTRDFALPAASAITVSMDLAFDIEEDWDYLFVEVSADGGQTYTQTKGLLLGTDDELTTPDNYPDPNGALARNNKRYGYTGSTGGEFLRVYHDLTPFAGQAIKLRFTYRTDEFTLGLGAFINNIVVSANGQPLFSDPVQEANGWVTVAGTRFPNYPIGPGWRLFSGTLSLPRYYLAEWRNFAGFDKAHRYNPQTIFNVANGNGQRERQVNLVPSNVPGMLVWLRDTRFGNEPFDTDQNILDTVRFSRGVTNEPSEGPKGGLLLVDAHPTPLRGPFNSTINFGFGDYAYPPFDNWNGLIQATNAAFGLSATPQITLTVSSGATLSTTTVLTPTVYQPQPAVTGFHDALAYFPGVEQLPQPVKTFEGPSAPGGPFLLRLKPYAFADPDASVIIPAAGYYPPRTPAGFTGRGAETSPPSANISTAETLYADSEALNLFDIISIGAMAGLNVTGEQSGNPGDYEVQFGYHFEILDQADNGSTGTVRFYSAERAATLDGSITPGLSASDPVTVTVDVTNVGSPTVLTVYSDFDEASATYVEGSATNGAFPVRATPAAVEAAVKANGLAGLEALAVTPGEATAVVWTSPTLLAAGEEAGSFSYQLTRDTSAPGVTVVNRVFGVSSPDANTEVLEFITGLRLFLPLIINQPAPTVQ